MDLELAAAGMPREFGAYGLRLGNVDRAQAMLVPAPPSWPRVDIRRRLGDGTGTEWITESAAVLRLQNGGEIGLDRTKGTATFVLPRRLRTVELVHPLLAPVGAVMAYWLGRESFHAGAFLVDGRAWAIIGERGSGKSTTVAQLALAGVDVIADDLLVVEGRRAYAGPRSIDLRGDAAEHLGIGEPLGVVGARPRWRVPLGAVDPEVELGGWIFLEWGDRITVERASAGDRLMRLRDSRAVSLPPRDPAALLDLATLPAWELRRPFGWDSLGESVDRLLDAVGRGRGSRQPS